MNLTLPIASSSEAAFPNGQLICVCSRVGSPHDGAAQEVGLLGWSVGWRIATRSFYHTGASASQPHAFRGKPRLLSRNRKRDAIGVPFSCNEEPRACNEGAGNFWGRLVGWSRGVHVPSTCAAGLSCRHCRDRGRAASRACSASRGRRGHRRLHSSPRGGQAQRQHRLSLHLAMNHVCSYHIRCDGRGACAWEIWRQKERQKRTPVDNPHVDLCV